MFGHDSSGYVKLGQV